MDQKPNQQAPTPEVMVATPQHPRPPYKKLLIIIIAVIIVSSGWLIYKNQSNQQTTPKQSENNSPKSPNPLQESSPVFYADLDYNPQNNLVTLLKTDTASGDMPVLMKTPPAASPTKFIYRIELFSEKNELIQTGWQSQYKKLIQTKKNTYQFRITSYFKPNFTIKLYLPPNQLIWSYKIK